jgi:hypothetical protein
MNTTELIERLSLQAGGLNALSHQRQARRTLCLGWVAMLSIFLTLFQIRSPEWDAANGFKWAWRLLILLAWDAMALAALWRLTQVAVAWKVSLKHLQTPLLVMAGVAAVHLSMAPESERAELIWGQTWQSCSVCIVLLSLPLLLALMWALRHTCATRLAALGATAGLVSGITAAVVYTWHCTEISPAFVLIWYGAGIGVSTALGRWLGPRCLRW